MLLFITNVLEFFVKQHATHSLLAPLDLFPASSTFPVLSFLIFSGVCLMVGTGRNSECGWKERSRYKFPTCFIVPWLLCSGLAVALFLRIWGSCVVVPLPQPLFSPLPIWAWVCNGFPLLLVPDTSNSLVGFLTTDCSSANSLFY